MADRVLIIGGGVIGLAVAWRLVQQGTGVVVLERGQPGRGTSHVAAGMLAPPKNGEEGTEIFDARSHSSVGVIASSEDMLEIDFADGKISEVGDQFGIGRR